MDKCYGERLITVATAIVFKLAQDLDPDQLGIMGDLFSIIGDQLGLLAGTKEAYNDCH
ncbi:MAG: hypothetical protein J6C55_00355 [Oscillospiraceae bacterium]|nr:hypothetical protein [Oscillospiraceae bacterium]